MAAVDEVVYGTHAGVGAPSTVSAKRQRSSIDVIGAPVLEEVYPVWLKASPSEKCAALRHPIFESVVLYLSMSPAGPVISALPQQQLICKWIAHEFPTLSATSPCCELQEVRNRFLCHVECIVFIGSDKTCLSSSA